MRRVLDGYHLLLHAFNDDSSSHAAAYARLSSLHKSVGVVISEFILDEFYGPLRKPQPTNSPAKNRQSSQPATKNSSKPEKPANLNATKITPTH